jgi:hypothetical protein
VTAATLELAAKLSDGELPMAINLTVSCRPAAAAHVKKQKGKRFLHSLPIRNSTIAKTMHLSMRPAATASDDQNVPLTSLQHLSNPGGAACEEKSSAQRKKNIPCQLRLDGELFHVFIS